MRTRTFRSAFIFGTAVFFSVFMRIPDRSFAALTDAEQMQQELPGPEDEPTIPESEAETAFSGFGDSTDSGTESGDLQFTTMEVSDCSLSGESGAYCYTVNSADRFYMNVPDGAVSDGPVEIQFSSGQVGIYSVEHDGIEDPNVLARKFEEKGTYTLTLYAIDTEAAAASTDSAAIRIPVTFRITDKTEAERRAIPEPTGFSFRSVTVNGQNMITPDHVLIPDRDGAYKIVFAAKDDPEITYAYSVDIDTTAPELRFSKEIGNGKIWAPLTYETVEPDSEVHAYRDYREYEFADQTFRRGGSYRVIVSDPAGNSRTYSFELREDPVKKILICMVCGVVLLAGIAVYMRYIRDHMNIL